jgi:glutathione synthase/RimK-type ligase-like ATP-grasp enzyme
VGGGRAVLKPAFGASGHLVRLVTADEVEEAVVAFAQEDARREVVVQAFLPELQESGEVSCVFFDSVFSHAALKRPAAGDFRTNSQYGGVNTRAELPEAVVRQAGAALGHLPEMPLYVRVDGVVREGTFVLMELELIEPALFLAMEPAAAERFATATVRRLA